mmetsp:Transcript_58040/g.164941  ORF Transcript_58040/g.164941 Transcript_58040/m.164941 type:complete len:257 (+) Transcript_58040:610-1380(+)
MAVARLMRQRTAAVSVPACASLSAAFAHHAVASAASWSSLLSAWCPVGSRKEDAKPWKSLLFSSTGCPPLCVCAATNLLTPRSSWGAVSVPATRPASSSPARACARWKAANRSSHARRSARFRCTTSNVLDETTAVACREPPQSCTGSWALSSIPSVRPSAASVSARSLRVSRIKGSSGSSGPSSPCSQPALRRLYSELSTAMERLKAADFSCSSAKDTRFGALQPGLVLALVLGRVDAAEEVRCEGLARGDGRLG